MLQEMGLVENRTSLLSTTSYPQEHTFSISAYEEILAGDKQVQAVFYARIGNSEKIQNLLEKEYSLSCYYKKLEVGQLCRLCHVDSVAEYNAAKSQSKLSSAQFSGRHGNQWKRKLVWCMITIYSFFLLFKKFDSHAYSCAEILRKKSGGSPSKLDFVSLEKIQKQEAAGLRLILGFSLSDASLSKAANRVNSMQSWQQQLMYKQLEELQRQRQLQHLDQGARQPAPPSQLSAVAKSATGNQSSATLGEMPVNDAYNYTWPNNFVGGVPNLPSNSHMFAVGNTNWMQSNCSGAMHNLSNGVVMSNDQSEAMPSMGFMSQQIDQTLHGIPVSGFGSVNQYSQFLGMPNNLHDLMTKADSTNADKATYTSRSFQTDQQLAAHSSLQDKTLANMRNFQGKHAFRNSPVQVFGNGVASGNLQQANNLQNSFEFQEFHGRQEQDDSSGNSQKPVAQIGSSSAVATLDPIEQKILFGTDDENLGFSFGGSLISGTGGDMSGHSSEGDFYGAFPSIHSGSWSALMQEAVQASSSEMGLQEEWTGLSFSKSDQLMVKPPITTNNIGKQPASWDDRNFQSASSLTSTPFPLFNDANATLISSIAPSNQHLSKSAHEENNRVLTKGPDSSFVSSSQGARNNEFHQNDNQSQLSENGLQAQMPPTTGVWAGQTIEQHDKSSGDIQFKSQDIGGGWINQQNLSNISIQSVNRLNGWKTSYPMAFRGDNISNYHEIDGNMWKTGENHVNLNSGLQPVESYIDSSKMQAEDSVTGNFGSVTNPNKLKLNQNMHQQVISTQQTVLGRHFALNMRVNSENDQDVDKNQNQPSRRPQTWESSLSTAVESLGDNHKNERGHGSVVSGEDYVGNTAKESLLTGNDQFPFVSGSQSSSIQSGQHIVASKMLQNSLGNLRTVEPSFPPNQPLSLQGPSNSVCHGSNSKGQKFVGKMDFSSHIVSDNPMIVSQRISVGADERKSRNTNNSFDRSTAQYSQNEMISQASNNMLELLPKVDQSRNDKSMNASDVPAQAAANISVANPPFDQCSNSQGFGLRLAPPSQRQGQSNYAPISPKPIGHSNSEAAYEDQPRSISTSSVHSVPLDENWDKISSLSGQKHKELAEASKNFFFSSSSASDFPSVGNQLQGKQQQQHISSTKDHLVQQQQQRQQHKSDTTALEALDQSLNFSFANQTNVSALVKNASLIRQSHGSHDGAVSGQSVQTPLPTLAGRFPTSSIASFAETPVPVGLQFSSGGTNHTKPTFTGFSQITSSGEKLPVTETKSASQSSASGISKQVAFSRMLHNVWTNISARQSQAGINPQMLTPNILQSIINNGRDKSLWGMPKAGDQVNKEGSATPVVGTSSTNSEKEENPVQGTPLNLIGAEKLDVACKTKNASQGEESVSKPPLHGDSSVPISSLVRLHHQHHQDVKQANNGQDPVLSSPLLHAPLTSMVSSCSDNDISGCMSKPLDVEQQNYSLLHQVQSMKASDSDVNKMTGKLQKEVGPGASGSGPGQWQNTAFKSPADGKVGAASQILFPPDAKMLNFASNDCEEQNSNTSTAGRHDIQTYMHPVTTSSTANIIGGRERTHISPQMAPSWFERYGSYQNGRMVSVYDAQRSEKAAMQQYLFHKVPARMDDSNVVEQRHDSSHASTYRQGTLTTKIAPNESSASLLPPDFMDHDVTIRSKKRKIATDVPWHKMVTEPQRLQSISMAELDWAQSVNRLIEKVDNEAETMDDGPLMPQSQRRLILSTQLMHQLFPAVPAAMIRKEASSAYESVAFSVAKSALADACGLVSSSESDSHVQSGNENMVSRELKTSKKVEDDTFSKLMEDFIKRSRKLETDFSRLDKRTSILDVRLECQELERFSIVNRLGKFHGRTHADGVEVSSTSETAHRRIFLQRYITALPVPGNLPEGVFCLSL